MTEISLSGRGARGESQADILRRTGQFGVLPTDTDAEAMGKLNDILAIQDSGITPVTGYYNRSTGALISDANFRSILAPCEPGRTIKVTSLVAGASLAMAVWLDDAGAVISSVNPGANGINDFYDREAAIAPALTASVAISGVAGYAIKLEIQKTVDMQSLQDWANERTSVEDQLEIHGNALTSYVEPSDFTLATGYLNFGGDGSAIANSGFRYSKVACHAGEVFSYTGRVSGAATCMAVFYDEANRIISGSQVEPGVNGENHEFYDYTLTAPAGAYFAGFTWEALFSPKALKVRRVLPDAADQISELANRDGRYWVGKSWVWAGTSIPTTGYPQLVAARLGASVSNVAVGSSPARHGVAARRSASDPYGYIGQFYASVAYSLSATLAEKEDFIANYASTYRAMLNAGRPDTLSTGEQNFIRSTSWEVKFADLIGSTDLVVWDHGHNDWAMNAIGTSAGATSGGSGDLLYLPTSLPTYPDPLTGVGGSADPSRDRGTFLGAMNYLIDRWNEVENRQEHLFIGHYERDRKANISAGQIAAQALWGFPLIETWKFSGASQQTIRAADGSVVMEGGNPLTITRALMDDDLHPYQPAFKERLARILAKQIAAIA